MLNINEEKEIVSKYRYFVDVKCDGTIYDFGDFYCSFNSYEYDKDSGICRYTICTFDKRSLTVKKFKDSEYFFSTYKKQDIYELKFDDTKELSINDLNKYDGFFFITANNYKWLFYMYDKKVINPYSIMQAIDVNDFVKRIEGRYNIFKINYTLH